MKRHPKILIVEDEKLLSWALARSLERSGYRVQQASTGQRAIADLESTAHDAVLVDYHLPDVDGLEVARRARRSNPETIVLLMSAYEPRDLQLDPRFVDGYFHKPIDLAELGAELQRILDEREHAAAAPESL